MVYSVALPFGLRARILGTKGKTELGSHFPHTNMH